MTSSLLLWTLAGLLLSIDIAGLLWPRWLGRMPRLVQLWARRPELMGGLQALAKVTPLIFAGWLLVAFLWGLAYLAGRPQPSPLLFSLLVAGSFLLPIAFWSFVRGTLKIIQAGGAVDPRITQE